MGKIKNVPFRIVCYVIMIIFLFIYLFPLFYVLNTSIKSAQDYMLNPTGLTKTWQFDNFITAWNKADFGQYIWNSVLYTSVCTVASVLMSLLLAFPISRRYVPLSWFLYFLFIEGLFLPGGMIDKMTTYDEYLASDEMAMKRQVYTLSEAEEEED